MALDTDVHFQIIRIAAAYSLLGVFVVTEVFLLLRRWFVRLLYLYLAL